jgi:BirA family transcriptional regulator, biotin operon repressor / biotin---[acetyl-CoA-carboxylase] ligase
MGQGVSLPDSYNLIAYESLGSTNDEALVLAPSSPDKTVIWALEQTAARGRRGRAWHAPKGNVYCSIILKPKVSAIECSQLGYLASLSIFDALKELCPDDSSATCKWPNDVLLNGKKISGILLETSFTDSTAPDWIILGVGINVNEHPQDTPYPATSMTNEGSTANAEQTLECFMRHFDQWLSLWLAGGFEPVRDVWLKRAAGLQQKILVRLENQELSGIFKGLDETGALILQQNENGEEKQRIITAADIFFPDTTPNITSES